MEKGVFFKEAPGVGDFVNVVDSLFTPQLDLMNQLFNEMNESGNMAEPNRTLHNVCYGMLQTWEKICGEALKLEAEKKGTHGTASQDAPGSTISPG